MPSLELAGSRRWGEIAPDSAIDLAATHRPCRHPFLRPPHQGEGDGGADQERADDTQARPSPWGGRAARPCPGQWDAKSNHGHPAMARPIPAGPDRPAGEASGSAGAAQAACQTGLRFSMKASMPSAASPAIMLQAMTSPAYW